MLIAPLKKTKLKTMGGCFKKKKKNDDKKIICLVDFLRKVRVFLIVIQKLCKIQSFYSFFSDFDQNFRYFLHYSKLGALLFLVVKIQVF